MASRSRSTVGWTLLYDAPLGSARAVDVPVETPLNIIYGNIPYAVMMLTPSDVEDFVLGFSLTEGVISDRNDIRGIAVSEQQNGLVATVDLAPDVLHRHLVRRRSMSGRTGCGLCGIESLEQLPAASRRLSGSPIAPQAIRRALQGLDDHQPLHRDTHAVHAAAWCDLSGLIVLAREDVGRHNALDKMIGACLGAGHSAAAGFAVITSRCSFEMLEKTAIFGATTLVAISAPTSLAIERAHALGIALVAVARRDNAVAFTQLSPNPKQGVAS